MKDTRRMMQPPLRLWLALGPPARSTPTAYPYRWVPRRPPPFPGRPHRRLPDNSLLAGRPQSSIYTSPHRRPHHRRHPQADPRDTPSYDRQRYCRRTRDPDNNRSSRWDTPVPLPSIPEETAGCMNSPGLRKSRFQCMASPSVVATDGRGSRKKQCYWTSPPRYWRCTLHLRGRSPA